MKNRNLIFGTAALTIMFSPEPFAQALVESNVAVKIAKDREPTDKWTWILGLGVGATPDYEGGDDYEAVPIPVVIAHKGYRSGELIGLHVKSNLLNDPNWRLGPSLNFRQGYSDVDSNRVDKLTNRGSSTELGVKGGYEFALQNDASLEVAVEVLADVSSGHDGALVTPSVDYRRPLDSRWTLGLGANATWADGNYMSHYFSVNQRDSSDTGLKEFNADRGFKDAAIRASLSWEWKNNWDVHGVAEFKRMLGDAEDSPIVDDEGDENQVFGGVALTYTWH